MEADRSIILQKKMILFLAVLVIGAFYSIIYLENRNEEVVKICEMVPEEIDLITVKEENDNEIISRRMMYMSASVAGDIEEGTSGEQEEYVMAIVQNEPEETEIVVEEARNEKQEVFVEEPVKENNTKTKLVKYRDLAESNPPTEYENKIEVTATAYCLCKKCCGKSPDNPNYGCTHSGLKIVPGSGMKVIAVDPKIIPLNSKVYVEGLNGAWDYGHAVAADTGSAIKELKIDLYMDTHTEALEWGRRKVNVYVLGE